MKTFLKTLAASAIGLGLALLALTAPAAHAQSFNVTNVISATNQIAGFPTNVAPSSVLGQGTGGPVRVDNNEFALLSCQMFVCTNVGGGSPTTNNLVLTILRSGSSSPPGVFTGTNLFTTNVTNILTTGWETWSNTTAYGSQITIPLSTTFGFINWSTNLPQQFVSGANWLGIGSIMPNATNFFATNFVVSLNKKIIPIRYP